MVEESARGNWGSWVEFLLSTIGCLVGLGNVWRFPYVCYTNGGAAFLVPFLIAMVVCGVPMFFLEMSICQFSNMGPGRVWVICPLFRGIGFGMVILTSIVTLYYNVIIAWALYYLAMSFSSPLPWTSCGNVWNTPNCVPQGGLEDDDLGLPLSGNFTTLLPPFSIESSSPDSVYDVINVTSSSLNVTSGALGTESSVAEFWALHVLQDSGRSISDLGVIRWQLLLCHLATWTVVFFCLFKDIKTSGKVVYVAAILPYVVLLALLIRGSFLPGAVDGVIFYLVPQWDKLKDWQVWLAASSQVFYSAGIAWGGVSTLASFNRFHNNVYRDALILPLLDALTSVFAGFVIFVFLGYMAHVQRTTVDKVVTQGTGLAFIAYPDALASMPLPQLWAVLFFLVLFTVGLDSQFVHVQTITSAIVDTVPHLLVRRKRWVTMGVCMLGFVLGLPFVTQGGQYVLKLCDWYVAAVSVMLMAVGEALVLAWVYGSHRLYEDITLMIGFKPNPIWHFFWRVVSPGFVLVTWTMGMVSWEPIEGYPGWTVGVGWLIALLPLIPIPVMAARQLYITPGSLMERIQTSIRPSPHWKPAEQKEGEAERSRALDILLTDYGEPAAADLTNGDAAVKDKTQV